MSIEKRRFQRIPTYMKALLKSHGAGEEEVEILITDLSGGGVGFEAPKDAVLSGVVEFSLPLEINVPVRAEIKRTHAKEDAMKHGADFVRVDPTLYQYLSSYVHRHIRTMGLQPLGSDFF